MPRARVSPLAPRTARFALAALALLLAASAAPTVGGTMPLTRRYAATVAHFDSIVGIANPERVAQWIGTVEAAAPGDSDLRVLTGAMRARVLMQQGRSDVARTLARTAVERAHATRDTLLECHATYVLAVTDAFANHPAAARAAAARILALARGPRQARVAALAHLVFAYTDLLADRYAAAERGYRASLRELSPTLDVVTRRIARIGLARACFQQGKLDDARRLDVELIRESRDVDDPINEAMALNNLAVHELLAGDPADALPCWRRALALQRRLGRWREAVTTASNLALALDRLKRFDESGELLVSLEDSVLAKVPAWQRADVVAGLAAVRYGQDRHGAAESLAVRAWGMCEAAQVWPDRKLAATRAGLMQRRGATAEAVALLDHWVDGARTHGATEDDVLQVQAEAAAHLCASGRFDASLARWTSICARIDTSDGVGHLKLGYALVNASIAASGTGDHARGRALLRAAVREWERGRLNFRSAEWREVLEVEAMRAWGSAAGSMREAPARRGEDPARAAFDLLQHVKARALDDRMPGPATRPVSAAVLQRSVLREGELALDVYPAYDSTLVFALTRRTLRMYVLHDADALHERLDRFARLAHEQGGDAASLRAAAARSLATLLLGPVADLVSRSRRIVVSGSGVLDELPWTLLPLPGAAAAGGGVDVASVPSLSVLARLRATPATEVARGPLVIAGSRGPDGRRLAGVEREVQFISRRYATADVREPRTPDEVGRALEAMRGADVIHVTAHFANDPEDPWRSGMLLGDGRRDDAWVRVGRLGALRTRARLATLAGCSSAATQAPGLNGQRGLATAFLAAGARAVIGTLWPVEDGASAELVARFYRALDEGHDAGSALALAQSGMKDSTPGRDVSRWAGFVLLGDPAVRITLARR